MLKIECYGMVMPLELERFNRYLLNMMQEKFYSKGDRL